jgi:tetratricopeptide (TPR) repeat protein
MTFTKESPFADETDRAQVPYFDALYQRAHIEYAMDSLKKAFKDFQTLVDNDYEFKSNCLIWQGTIYLRIGNNNKACSKFTEAKFAARTEQDMLDVKEMIVEYCDSTDNNR